MSSLLPAGEAVAQHLQARQLLHVACWFADFRAFSPVTRQVCSPLLGNCRLRQAGLCSYVSEAAFGWLRWCADGGVVLPFLQRLQCWRVAVWCASRSCCSMPRWQRKRYRYAELTLTGPSTLSQLWMVDALAGCTACVHNSLHTSTRCRTLRWLCNFESGEVN
jgi:hypothetical protein